MPHDVASDQGLQCLLTGFSIKKYRLKATKYADTPNMTIGLIQHITAEESTSIQWVNTLVSHCNHGPTTKAGGSRGTGEKFGQ